MLGSEAVQFHNLVAGGGAAQKFNAVARTIQMVGEEADERFVGGAVHGWGGDFNPQFIAQGLADFVGGRARLKLYG